MSFWNTDRLVLKQNQQKLIEPFDPQFAKQGAYELSLGPEVFITSEPNATKRELALGEQLSIPPGQFGLLLTEEVVTVPDDAIAFISVRFTIKRRGLVNVSGFHVDPGFSGRLKFAVYNAGSQSIVVARGERVFMIWFSDMNATTPDPYQGVSAGQKEITSQDVMFIQGEVASPAALKKQIDELRKDHDQRLTTLDGEMKQKLSTLDDKIATWRQITITVLTALGFGILLLVVREALQRTPSPSTAPSIESTRQRDPVPNLNASSPPTTGINGNSTTTPTPRTEIKLEPSK
jgi:dCTP deaminase